MNLCLCSLGGDHHVKPCGCRQVLTGHVTDSRLTVTVPISLSYSHIKFTTYRAPVARLVTRYYRYMLVRCTSRSLAFARSIALLNCSLFKSRIMVQGLPSSGFAKRFP